MNVSPLQYVVLVVGSTFACMSAGVLWGFAGFGFAAGLLTVGITTAEVLYGAITEKR